MAMLCFDFKFHFQNGTRMTTSGKYCHDFPRLAKESGYCFELHKGRVNWAEIESLNIDDIVNNRNFQLLEQNLVNVINCNLEREYDVKILDQNFVKLFQLAQLGVDYLSYCELYLDRCVILLQEQLASYQEECELLREDNRKKNEQLKESKRKIKAESFYECKKCEKVFLTEVYLRSHEKRRHTNVSETYKIHETPKLELMNKSQQTDEEKKTHAASTQTIIEVENTKEKENEISFLKKEHELKMGNLENELKALKERLQNTEVKLAEKNESSDVSHSQQYHFPPNSLFYPPVIPFISPYVSQPQYITADYSQQSFVQQTLQKPLEKKPMIEKQLQVGEEIYPEIITTPNITKKDLQERKETLVEEPIKPKIIKSRRKLQYNKENLDPKFQSLEEEIKPTPFPRKPKKLLRNTEKEDSITSVTSFTPDESKIQEKTKEENKEEKVVSSPAVQDKERKSKLFFKKLVSKNSPKIQVLSQNLKRSLTNLYDSVSSSSKDSLKTKDSEKDLKSDIVEGLNSRLKELGIDPEWSGIPKETMKKKFKTLEHRRNLLARENPKYPSIRKRLEKTIFSKMGKSSAVLSQEKQTASVESLYEDSHESPVPSTLKDQAMLEIKKEKETGSGSIQNQASSMYDFDFDSGSDSSNVEVPIKLNKESDKFPSHPNFPEKIENDIEEIKIENEVVKPPVREMDFSVFQIGKAKGTSQKQDANPSKPSLLNTADELQTDSEFEDDFLKEFEETSFKSIDGFLNSTENYRKVRENQTNDKTENQSILKNSQSNQMKPGSNVKKKVLFADYPVTESQSSSTTLNEIKSKLNVKKNNKSDTWSSDSDWDQ